MLRRGLTQERLAAELGISHPYVSDVLNGKRKAPEIRRRLVTEFNFPPRLVGLNRDLSPIAKYKRRTRWSKVPTAFAHSISKPSPMMPDFGGPTQ